MKMQMQVSALVGALQVVSIVPPRAITQQGGSGYLFVARQGEDGKAECFVYSRDSQHVARSHFMLDSLDEEGSCIFPVEFVGGLQFLKDDTLTIESKSDGDNHTVSYESSSGATLERASIDPRLIAPCDKDFEAATDSGPQFSVGMLREAITMARPFISDVKEKTPENFKSFQIFDGSKPDWEKGNGTLYASNATQAFYFQSEAFLNHGLAVHATHMPLLLSFLSKNKGMVSIRYGATMTFAVDAEGNVFGWVQHAKTHDKYAYYGLKQDGFVLHVPKGPMLNALGWVIQALEKNRDKIRVAFDHKEKTLSFQVSDTSGGKGSGKSFPILVPNVEMQVEGDFAFNVNSEHLLALVKDVKGNEVELRVSVRPAGGGRLKDQALFRTIDVFWMDMNGAVLNLMQTKMVEVTTPDGVERQPENGFKCKVTRFMPSKD